MASTSITCPASSSSANTKIRFSFLCGSEWKSVVQSPGLPGQSVEDNVPCNWWPSQVKLFNTGNDAWCFKTLSFKLGTLKFNISDGKVQLGHGGELEFKLGFNQSVYR